MVRPGSQVHSAVPLNVPAKTFSLMPYVRLLRKPRAGLATPGCPYSIWYRRRVLYSQKWLKGMSKRSLI